MDRDTSIGSHCEVDPDRLRMKGLPTGAENFSVVEVGAGAAPRQDGYRCCGYWDLRLTDKE